MNPMVSAALGAILRWALTGLAGWLVSHGIWQQAEAASYVMAASLALLSLGWELWRKYKGRIKFLTALTMTPGASEADVKAHLKAGGATPPVSTPVTQVPVAAAR